MRSFAVKQVYLRLLQFPAFNEILNGIVFYIGQSDFLIL
jgi:hypothetical protein